MILYGTTSASIEISDRILKKRVSRRGVVCYNGVVKRSV